MEQTYQPPNPTIMDAIQLRTSLLQRIEQADEKLLRVINSVVETVVAEYVEEGTVVEEVPDFAKPLTKEELLAELREGLEEYERGEYVTLEEMEKEAETW